jgi:hypothetical protein
MNATAITPVPVHHQPLLALELTAVEDAAVDADDLRHRARVAHHAATRPCRRRIELRGGDGPQRWDLLERRHVVLRRRGQLDLLRRHRSVREQIELVRLAVGDVDRVERLVGLDRLAVDLLDEVALADLIAALLAAEVVDDVDAALRELLAVRPAQLAAAAAGLVAGNEAQGADE